MKCKSCNNYKTSNICFDCRHYDKRIDYYEEKKQSFEEWWDTAYSDGSFHICKKFAEGIWKAAQESKED